MAPYREVKVRMRTMRWWMAISGMVAAALAACSVSNPDHCANLEGNATCVARDSNYPYCNKCTSANNGCVSDPVNATCDAGETTTPGGTSSTSTPATTDPTTTTTRPTGSTTTGSTSDPSTSESSTTSSSSSTSTDSSSGSTGGSTGDPPPVCGNDVREPPEVCDGADLNDLDCVIKDSDKYSGGTLQCKADCMAYDELNCCLATGQTCPLNGQKCCAPGTCIVSCG